MFNKLKFPKVAALAIGGILSVAVLVMGFSVLQNASSRAEDQIPRDVVISDITSSSAKVSWTTGTKTQGVIEYGITPTSLNLLAPESESATAHESDLTLLSSGTTYYLQISIGGKKYDNAGVPWTFSTKGEGDTSETTTSPLKPSTRPTPISRVVIPNAGASTCDESDCTLIKAKLGKGCTTLDYVKCTKKISPTFAPLTTP